MKLYFPHCVLKNKNALCIKLIVKENIKMMKLEHANICVTNIDEMIGFLKRHFQNSK